LTSGNKFRPQPAARDDETRRCFSIQEKAIDRINKMNQIKHRVTSGRAVIALCFIPSILCILSDCFS